MAGRACPAPTDCHKWVANERGKGGRQPAPSSWRVIDRERVVAQGPSESPRPLARPALRARAPLSLRDISPRSGESPFDKGASLSPLRGFGGTPEFQIGAEGAGVKNEK